MDIKNESFFTAHFKGIGKNDEERINRAKPRREAWFCLPEGRTRVRREARFIRSIKRKSLTVF